MNEENIKNLYFNEQYSISEISRTLNISKYLLKKSLINGDGKLPSRFIKKYQDEVFLKIENYPNFEISNYGRIFNISKDKFVNPKIKKQHPYITLNSKNRAQTVSIGLLVARHFLEREPLNQFEKVVYIDGNKYNTYYKNLRWESDLSELVFGKLFVVKRDNLKNNKWICKCLACGNDNVSVSSKKLINGIRTSCGCLNEIPWKSYQDIPADFWYNIVNGARQRGIKFYISIEYAWNLFLNQKRKCKLSNLELSFSKEKRTASLDRIDSSKDYIENNVQWIHKDINLMKNKFPQKDFIEICKLVAKNN